MIMIRKRYSFIFGAKPPTLFSYFVAIMRPGTEPNIGIKVHKSVAKNLFLCFPLNNKDIILQYETYIKNAKNIIIKTDICLFLRYFTNLFFILQKVVKTKAKNCSERKNKFEIPCITKRIIKEIPSHCIKAITVFHNCFHKFTGFTYTPDDE